MKPLRERNQAVVGAVTLVVLVLAVFLAYHAEDLPLFGGAEYTANFAESAGLNPGDEVRVAGIKVGKVTDVGLGRGQVVVRFRVAGAKVGDQSRVSIEIKTLLGEKYLAVRSAGARPQDPGVPIPVDRTSTPYEIPDAFNRLTHTINDINTDQLAQSFRVLAATFAHTPDDVGKTLSGLSRLSETISSRDQALNQLLASAANVSGVVARRDDQVAKLLTDGSRLLDELHRRQDAIHQLLVGTQHLADQLRGLVEDNQAQLHPALDQLEKVTALLQRDQDALAHGIAAMAPYIRAYTNVVGNGRWFDGYICGLINPSINLGGGLEFNRGTCAPPKPASSGPKLPMMFGGNR